MSYCQITQITITRAGEDHADWHVFASPTVNWLNKSGASFWNLNYICRTMSLAEINIWPRAITVLTPRTFQVIHCPDMACISEQYWFDTFRKKTAKLWIIKWQAFLHIFSKITRKHNHTRRLCPVLPSHGYGTIHFTNVYEEMESILRVHATNILRPISNLTKLFIFTTSLMVSNLEV